MWIRTLAACVLGAACLPWLLTGCNRREPASVVLATSTDAPLLPPILQAFTRETGIEVRAITDTEATKTTGLVDRLLSEADTPRTDVWWSNEASSTVMLAARGMFEPLDADGTLWREFALRARVIAHRTNAFSDAPPPARLSDLLAPGLRGRVGIARPQFGTTRSHIAALVAAHGPERTRTFLQALKDNGVRLYHGNSAVVRALANAEIDVGLTDTDDALAGIREGWPIGFIFEPRDPTTTQAPPALQSLGALVIPNTIAIVRGGPHPNHARTLAAFLASEKVETMLAQSDSRNVPIRAALDPTLRPTGLESFPTGDAAMPVTTREIAAAIPEADRIIHDVFPLE